MTKSAIPFFRKWYRAAVFNLLLVAMVGTLLRYKIIASVPWINHKYVLHGHSHFAFSGWISLVLMTAIFERIHHAELTEIVVKAKWLLWAQLITAYGMLITFPIYGYAPIPILFSTLSILVSYLFTFRVWKYCNQLIWGQNASLAIKSALVFLVISSFGAFWLAFLMATKSPSQPLYFSALYSFLHFQYNGWFFFGLAGLLLSMPGFRILNEKSLFHTGLKWMAYACLPAVTLSGLWMEVPTFIYMIAGAAAFIQIAGVGMMFSSIKAIGTAFSHHFSKVERWLYTLSGIAFLIRILLQTLSTIPALSKFAFAYRPVVIGYLHLILLGCITLFLLSYLFGRGIWDTHRKAAYIGVSIFVAGIFGTEITLMTQGFGYIGWVNIPFTNEVLFGSATLLFTGIFTLFLSSRTKPILLNESTGKA